MTKPKLILLRHGQSAWNKANLFTGWVDIPMSEEGIQECMKAGKKIADVPIDVIFTSSLIRAQMTVPLALLHHKSGKIPVFLHPGQGRVEEWGGVYSEEAQKQLIPVYQSWELNERMYGRLQGLNKAETAQKYGAEQVHIWRRSYDVKPPEGESLKMTAERTLPYFKKNIVPYLEKGKTVLIAAHGNSLRSIAMYIENLSQEEVVALELPTGEPRLYTFDRGRYDRS
ncbi:MAG: 2,3-bisphosphoglycerate-dependent phosphoglycerate mutase [Verrucomicrobia bacterium]|nr:2,3-bisphosphoglycerate-dependent phosphoglycerate mutase [Verrucomicrobiota bacterium]MBU6446503.1 2,3-bisphosphoglycerate-dependent phosphoglycerate mutase [Verrucomicrobiota bacterium]MDE3048053.1 2,3-bisphosphoglycerate-dependent phosphoglycerate mutase [Verrucomicrobiota bacterium]